MRADGGRDQADPQQGAHRRQPRPPAVSVSQRPLRQACRECLSVRRASASQTGLSARRAAAGGGATLALSRSRPRYTPTVAFLDLPVGHSGAGALGLLRVWDSRTWKMCALGLSHLENVLPRVPALGALLGVHLEQCLVRYWCLHGARTMFGWKDGWMDGLELWVPVGLAAASAYGVPAMCVGPRRRRGAAEERPLLPSGPCVITETRHLNRPSGRAVCRGCCGMRGLRPGECNSAGWTGDGSAM